MEASSQYVKHQWVKLFALLIFFFNSFLLPEGLTVVLLLTPVWVYFLYLQQRFSVALFIMTILLLYSVVHLVEGVDIYYYSISISILSALAIFVVCCHYFINNSRVDWDDIFRHVAILNFLFVIISIPMLFVPVLKPLVWYLKPISPGIPVIPRLKLFTEEASHYSYWMAPIAIFFYSKALFFKTEKPFFTLFIITLPLLFAFAIGATSILVGTGVLVILIYANRIFSSNNKKLAFLSTLIAVPLILITCYNMFPNNILFHRIHNIFNGHDTSFRGRTYESFILANKIVAQKSYWWGIGPGQLKLTGRSVIMDFYKYNTAPAVVRIPNACAETIVYFGYLGLAIRLITEIYLFFRTKVSANPYRLWLFLFAFIFQFAGSYITNVAEYIIFIFAFSPIFPEFVDTKNKKVPAPVLSPTV